MIELFIECRFTLKLVRYMIIAYSHIQRAVKYSQHSSFPPYEKALSEAGYNAKLKFNPNKKKEYDMFNPSCSKNVITEVGDYFLKLLNKHFPRQCKLHTILNKNTVKVS